MPRCFFSTFHNLHTMTLNFTTTPQELQADPLLKQLFLKVNACIREHMLVRQQQCPEGTKQFFAEKEIDVRRRLAGWVADRDLEQLPQTFTKKKKKGIVNPWNVLLSEENSKKQFDKESVTLLQPKYYVLKENYVTFLNLGSDDTWNVFCSQNNVDFLSEEEKASLSLRYERLKADYERYKWLREEADRRTAANKLEASKKMGGHISMYDKDMRDVYDRICAMYT